MYLLSVRYHTVITPQAASPSVFDHHPLLYNIHIRRRSFFANG